MRQESLCSGLFLRGVSDEFGVSSERNLTNTKFPDGKTYHKMPCLCYLSNLTAPLSIHCHGWKRKKAAILVCRGFVRTTPDIALFDELVESLCSWLKMKSGEGMETWGGQCETVSSNCTKYYKITLQIETRRNVTGWGQRWPKDAIITEFRTPFEKFKRVKSNELYLQYTFVQVVLVISRHPCRI